MDLAGIEPASESLSLEASPITATPFTFPHPAGEQRPSGFSSFIIRLQTQSFACIVSRNNDAGYRTYGCDRADGCDYAATANSLSAFNFKNPVLSWSGPRMASSTSKPPSKPVQALVNKSLNSLLLNHKTQVRSINRGYKFQIPAWWAVTVQTGCIEAPESGSSIIFIQKCRSFSASCQTCNVFLTKMDALLPET